MTLAKPPANTPALYATEGVALADKTCVAHYFLGSYDCWVVEWDGADRLFGLVCIGDSQNAEWGYASLAEIEAVRIPIKVDGAVLGSLPIESETHWTPKPMREALAQRSDLAHTL